MENKEFYEQKNVGEFYNNFNQLFDSEITLFDLAAPDYTGKVIVDIGIGAGRTTEFLLHKGSKYIGFDYSETMIEEARKKYPETELKVCDARNMSFIEDNFADFVLFSYNGIDSVNDKDRGLILKECYRILKTGGSFAFSCHNADYRYFDKMPWQQPLQYNYYYFKHILKVLLNLGKINRLKRQNRYSDNYSIIIDEAHFYSLFHYYVKPEYQIKILENMGFSNIKIIGKDGKVVESHQTGESDFLYYYCIKK
jgi:ubiquinone/menaquinone biosynthesis C-methylase UbiE